MPKPANLAALAANPNPRSSRGLFLDAEEYAELLTMTADDAQLAWTVQVNHQSYSETHLVYSMHHAAAVALDDMTGGAPQTGNTYVMRARIGPGPQVFIEVTP